MKLVYGMKLVRYEASVHMCEASCTVWIVYSIASVEVSVQYEVSVRVWS